MNSNNPIFHKARFEITPDEFKQKLLAKIDQSPHPEYVTMFAPPSRNIYRLPLLITTSVCSIAFVVLVASGILFESYQKISRKIVVVTQKVELLYLKK